MGIKLPIRLQPLWLTVSPTHLADLVGLIRDLLWILSAVPFSSRAARSQAGRVARLQA